MSNYNRAAQVAASCKTSGQLTTAAKFARLAYLADLKTRQDTKGISAHACRKSKSMFNSYKTLIDDIRARRAELKKWGC